MGMLPWPVIKMSCSSRRRLFQRCQQQFVIAFGQDAFAAIVELCLPILRAEGIFECTDREIAGPFQRSSVLKLDRDDVWTH